MADLQGQAGPVVAGTGHRIDKIRDELDVVNAALESFLVEVRPSHVISGMATGFDQLLARAARDHGIPWTAAIPFPGQHLRWTDDEQRRYHELLESASDIVIVSPSYVGPWVMQVRNEWMVDKCSILASYWNGTPGGTANCLRYAKRIKRVVRSLYGISKAT